MKLYDYFRSSAAYRVRIALNLKSMNVERTFVHLAPSRLEQEAPAYKVVNPQGLVPSLLLDDGNVLSQSLAIIEYLDELHPQPSLLPKDPLGRARVRAYSQLVACDIHPVNNARVLRYLKSPLGHAQSEIDNWVRHWIKLGFEALEVQIGSNGYCYGESVSVADVCLVPQIFNARRFDLDLSGYQRILKVEENCGALPQFAAAHPSNQPDAE